MNEVTIFRQFGSKKRILEELVQSFSYAPKLAHLISEKVSWDLEKDLLMISEEYQKRLEELKDFILLGFREASMFPEIDVEISKIKQQLKDDLIKYFNEMQKQGKITTNTNLEAQAMNFIWLNFGYFISNARLESDIRQEEYLENSVQLFTRALTP